MNLKHLAFVCLFLSACSTSTTVKEIKGPDGSTHKHITCSEAERCYAKATSDCGTYKIVNAVTEKDGSDLLIKMLVKCTGTQVTVKPVINKKSVKKR